MAASAIASLPFIRTGRTASSAGSAGSTLAVVMRTISRPLRASVDGEDRVGTDAGAEDAARAGRGVGQPGGVVAELVHDRCVQLEQVMGADVDAEPASPARAGHIDREDR